MPDDTVLREKFLRAYSNIHDTLREDIVVVVEKKPYSWNAAFFEVKENTSLGKKVLKTLNEMGIL